MGSAAAGWLQLGLLVVALAVVHRPLGDWMARVFTAEAHWRVEKLTLPGGRGGRRRRAALAHLPAQRAGLLPGRRAGALRAAAAAGPAPAGQRHGPVEPSSAWNTAVSFVTNTNWQGYAGESTMGHLVQMAGLAVQNFVSAAVGLAVLVALVARVRPPRHRPAGQRRGWTSPRRRPAAAAPRRPRDRGHGAGRGRAEPAGGGGDVTTLAGGSQFVPGGRWPRRRPSRSWAPTAAGSTTPTPRTPSRGRPRVGVAVPGLPHAGHPVLPAALREDGRGPQAGPGHPRRDGPAGRDLAGAGQRLPGRRAARGPGGPLRRAAVLAVRGVHDADLDRRGQLDARQLHPAGRHGACST